METPDIQLIANLIVRSPRGRILLAQYDPASESPEDAENTRWWLPGSQLAPYQHPDEAAKAALADFPWLAVGRLELRRVQSFRGRRGWHVSFDYYIEADGEPALDCEVPATWHARDGLPHTTHGQWERQTIDAVLDQSQGGIYSDGR